MGSLENWHWTSTCTSFWCKRQYYDRQMSYAVSWQRTEHSWNAQADCTFSRKVLIFLHLDLSGMWKSWKDCLFHLTFHLINCLEGCLFYSRQSIIFTRVLARTKVKSLYPHKPFRGLRIHHEYSRNLLQLPKRVLCSHFEQSICPKMRQLLQAKPSKDNYWWQSLWRRWFGCKAWDGVILTLGYLISTDVNATSDIFIVNILEL